jgi:uncharacterized protein involved in exopolysaccharide biosynthesis
MQESKINLDTENNEITLKQLIQKLAISLSYYWKYKWVFIILVFIGCTIGVGYTLYKTKTIYVANMSFTMEQKNASGGALGGLASTLGLGEIGSTGGGGMFGGENILHLMKSNRIIHQSLKEQQKDLNGDNLLNAYLKNNFQQSIKNKKIKLFKKNLKEVKFSRVEDSILQVISNNIRENQILADRLDKKTTIINLEVKDVNEQWAYLFSKALVKNAIDLYLEIKIGKLLRAEEELINKRDSIRSLLDGSITTLAFETDLNSHTPLMRYKTNQVKKQIDVEVLKSMYANVIQNLEVTRIQRAQEEPIIEIIDEPFLPLKAVKSSKLKGGLIGAFIFGFVTFLYFMIRKLLS